jgi:hypothetical protein
VLFFSHPCDLCLSCSMMSFTHPNRIGYTKKKNSISTQLSSFKLLHIFDNPVRE